MCAASAGDVEVPVPVPDKANDSTVRLLSFNINGLKTLMEYHPWNELKTLRAMFDFLKSDIVTFQEIKLQRDDVDLKLADVPGFKSFVTVPKTKKGYSGVAVFIRVSTLPWLKVIRVEEGITGWLDVRGKQCSYRKLEQMCETDIPIGGYQHDIEKAVGLELDAQGRAIVVEMESGLVVISVYCPANSGLTEEGENQRCLFLQCLLKRVENLKNMGKHVVVMGDINVSPGLLDKDEYIREGLADGVLVKCQPGQDDMELINRNQAIEFRKRSSPSRAILNTYLWDTSEFTDNTEKILYDLGREMHPKRTKMYTCWNTQKNYRPMNMGSRIDLFLSTFKDGVNQCDILRYLYGSDHCPIFCDVDTSMIERKDTAGQSHIKHFEAKMFYGLNQSRSIDSFFKAKPKSTPASATASATASPSPISTQISTQPASSQEANKKRSLDAGYTSRKVQKGQSSLRTFFTNGPKQQPQSDSLFVQDSDDEELFANQPSTPPDLTTPVPKLAASTFNALLQSKTSVPLCKHGDESVLRTVSKGENMGKKFWCCSKPRGEPWDEADANANERSCGFFKWGSK